MSFLTDYHEDWPDRFDQYENENFSLLTDDLNLKTNLLFGNGKFNFKSHSSFDFLPKQTANHRYKLEHDGKVATVFEHNSYGETSIETQSKLYSKDNFSFGSYSKMVLDQGEHRRNFSLLAQIRIHFKDFFLCSVGVEEWDFFKGGPEIFSAYASFGKKLKNDSRVSLNGYLRYDKSQSLVDTTKFYVLGESESFNGVFEIVNNNSIAEGEVKPSTDTVKETQETTTKSHNVNINAKFYKELDENTMVGGIYAYDVNTKNSDVDFLFSKKVDRVKILGKLSTDRSFTSALESNFDGVKVALACKSTLGCKTDKIGDNEITKHWVDYKFGFSMELNRI